MVSFYDSAIFAATSAARPRADVAYCIHALARRVSKTHNWTVSCSYLSVCYMMIYWTKISLDCCYHLCRSLSNLCWSFIALWGKEIQHLERNLWIILDHGGLLLTCPTSEMIPALSVSLSKVEIKPFDKYFIDGFLNFIFIDNFKIPSCLNKQWSYNAAKFWVLKIKGYNSLFLRCFYL